MADRRLELTSAPATLRTEFFLVLTLVLSVFFLTSAGFDTSEGAYDYAVARQIWTQRALGFAQPREGVYTVAPNGRTYASHEFGNALFLLPVAGLSVVLDKTLASRYDSRRIGFVTGFLESLMPVIYCALTTALQYAMLRIIFEKSITTALAASMAFAFCTFVWTYSRNLFDGVLCMCILTGAMLAMMQFTRTRKMHYFLIATALGGLGVITRLTMVLLLVVFLVYLTMVFWKDRKWLMRLVLIGGTVLTPFAAWQMYYNHLRTGHWLIAPLMSPQYAYSCGLTGDLGVGMSGLLLSPGKSIFVYVPLALLSIVCFHRFMADYPCEATSAVLLSALWLVIHAKMATNWYGAWGWGPRHFITIAPVLVLPACVGWEWMKKNIWRRILLRCALTWGAVLSVASIIGNWLFRMSLADTQGRLDAMIWSLRRGQALDMIQGAMSNLRNMTLHKPGTYMPWFSPVDNYASNTVNVWINSAAYAGVSPLLLSAAALTLAAVAVYCLMSLRQIIRYSFDAEAL
jgi:hypothetical protein